MEDVLPSTNDRIQRPSRSLPHEKPFRCTRCSACPPMVPGHGIRRDNEYKRNGTAIFRSGGTQSRQHFTRALRTDRPSVRAAGPGYRHRLSSARTIHLVMDNFNIHRKKSLSDHLGPAQAITSEPPQSPLHTKTEAGSIRPNRTQPHLPQCLGKRRIPLSNGYSLRPGMGSKGDHQRLRIRWHFTRRMPPEVRLSKECFYASKT